jgi:hypothetical protein
MNINFTGRYRHWRDFFSRLRSILQKLCADPLVRLVYCTSGRFNIIADIISTTEDGLYEFVEGQVENMPGVKDCELFIAQEVRYGEIYPVEYNFRAAH